MEWFLLLALVGLAGLLFLAGWVWALVTAFRQHTGWGVACLFVVPALLFAIVHWRVARRPFVMQLIALGSGLLGALGIVFADPGVGRFDPASAALPAFPQLSLERGQDLPGGVTRHEVLLGDQNGFYAAPGHGGKVWVYLPARVATALPGSLPCVLIAPAGTNGLYGAFLGQPDQPEHLPYAQAGFVVVAYELDGPMAQGDETEAGRFRAYQAWRSVMAGLVDARIALELTLARLPVVNPRAVFAAGHGSAGSHALLFAAHEPRLAGCVAYAPVCDWERRQEVRGGAVWYLPRVKAFMRRASPVTHIEWLRAPIFLFHAADDATVPIADTRDLAARLRSQGTEVALEVVETGDHYEAMKREGFPRAIAWLEARAAAIPGVQLRPLAPAPADPGAAPGVASSAPAMADWNDPEEILRRVSGADPDVRREAIAQWFRRGQHRAEGARKAMLDALGAARGESIVLKYLLKSVEDDPPSPAEALACLATAPPELRRELLLRLLRKKPLPVPADQLAAIADGLPDDPEGLNEEALLLCGRPRPGMGPRLVAARGLEWARSDDGRALLGFLPLSELAALTRVQDPAVRLIAVALYTARGPAVGLAPLGTMLKDPVPAVRQEAAGGLQALGKAEAAVQLLDAIAVEQDATTRTRMRRALANLPPEEVQAVLVGLLVDASPERRVLGVRGIAASATPNTVRELGRALVDPDPTVCKAALDALGELRTSRTQGVPDAVRMLTQAIGRVALEHKDPELKKLARLLYFQINQRLPEQDMKPR